MQDLQKRYKRWSECLEAQVRQNPRVQSLQLQAVKIDIIWRVMNSRSHTSVDVQKKCEEAVFWGLSNVSDMHLLLALR